MVDYKPQFKPIYLPGESIVDKINYAFSNSFEHKTIDDFTDDFLVTFKNDFPKTSKEIFEGKVIYASVTAGVVGGIITNYLGAHIADALNFSHKFIENISFVSEMLGHVVGYGLTYFSMSKKEGKSHREITRDLVRTTAISLPIAFGVYPLVRNYLADIYMSTVAPAAATVLSQLTLLLPYARSIKYSVKRLGPKVDKYLNRITYFNIDKSKVIGMLDEIIETEKNIDLKEKIVKQTHDVPKEEVIESILVSSKEKTLSPIYVENKNTDKSIDTLAS